MNFTPGVNLSNHFDSALDDNGLMFVEQTSSRHGPRPPRDRHPRLLHLTRIFRSPSEMRPKDSCFSRKEPAAAGPSIDLRSIQIVILESFQNALELIRFEGAARLPAERI